MIFVDYWISFLSINFQFLLTTKKKKKNCIIYITETFETPTFFHISIILKNKTIKKNKTLNTVTISNPITISPQNKPDKIYILQPQKKTQYKNLFLNLCLSFKCKLSPTNTARPIRRNPKREKLDADLSLFPCDGKRIQLSHIRLLERLQVKSFVLILGV